MLHPFKGAVWTWVDTGEDLILYSHMILVVRKPVFGVYDQVQHKPGCTAIEDC